jgi:hypothetical protein
MMESSPYPSARNDDCFDPGAGPAHVASHAPFGRLMAQPNDMDRSKAEPSLTLIRWISMVEVEMSLVQDDTKYIVDGLVG